MISERLIIIAVFCCIAFGNANPLGDTDVVWPSQSTNAFDGGELNSCVALNVENTSFCNIDYEVPSYVAATAEVLLSEIIGALSIISDRANQADCRATLREVLCAQKFPRCIRGEVGTGIQVQIDFTQNCEQRLQSSCDDRTFSQIQGQYLCGFHNLTEQVRFSDTPCRSVSSYGYDLQVCHTAIDSNTMMTPWMFEILKQKDAVTHRQLNGIGQLVQHDQACLRKWATYFCQSVGQCSRDGTRAELINTVEQCEELLSWWVFVKRSFRLIYYVKRGMPITLKTN